MLTVTDHLAWGEKQISLAPVQKRNPFSLLRRGPVPSVCVAAESSVAFFLGWPPHFIRKREDFPAFHMATRPLPYRKSLHTRARCGRLSLAAQGARGRKVLPLGDGKRYIRSATNRDREVYSSRRAKPQAQTIRLPPPRMSYGRALIEAIPC